MHRIKHASWITTTLRNKSNIITHSHSEFIIDFATMLPGQPKPEVSNRIIMTPEHTKRLLNALMDNITKYESQFGFIDLGMPLPDFNNGPKS